MRFKSNIATLLILGCLLCGISVDAFAQKKKKDKKKEQDKEVTKHERANAEYLLIDAQKYFLLEDYKKAQAFLEQSLDVDPKNHAAHFKLAEIHFTTSETDKGLDAITAALNLVKDNKYYYLLAAQLYKQKNDFASAALAYEQMIENTDDYHDYLLDLSDVYVTLGQHKKAIATIETLEQRFGSNGRFALQKVSLFLSADMNKEAIDLVKDLIDSGTDDEEFVLEYANLVSSYRSVQEAIDFLETRERTGKQDLFLIQLYLDINQGEKAKELMLNAFSSPLVDVENKLVMINDLLEQPDLEQNQALFISLQNTLEEQYPNNPQVLEMSGRVYLELSEVSGESREDYQKKAIERFIQVKDLNPSDFQVWTRILTAEYDSKNWNQLLEHSNEALDLYPNQGLFYFHNGAANLETANHDDAIDALKQGAKLSLSNSLLKSRILSKEAEVLLSQEDIDEAIKKFEQALSEQNTHPEVLNTYSFQLALRKIDLAKALDLSKHLIGFDRSSLDYAFTRGFVLFEAEQFAEAKQMLESVLEENGTGAGGPLLELYGDILFKLNMVDEALTQWQKAKSVGGTSDKIDQKIETKQYN